MDRIDQPDAGASSISARKTDGFRFGRYFLEKRLAHGGMAEVFVGRDTEQPLHSGQCVVKCILPELATDAQFLAMFLNEAQLAAQMAHPNVVRVIDFGEQDGLLYMAMEYVDGVDCWRLFRRMHPFGEKHNGITAYIVSEVLAGLDYVHHMRDVNGHPLNVVHRDMSPSNIYLSLDGDVKLGDFGIARIESPRYRAITYTPRGKFGYVAPEQIEGRAVDIRADLFAVGIVLAELLIGVKLFQGPSQLSVLLEIRDGRYATLDQNAEKIPPALRPVLEKALALEPGDRYPTAAAFREAMLSFVEETGATRAELAAVVRQAREANEARRAADQVESAVAQGEAATDSVTNILETRRPAPRPSLVPTNPNEAAPTVWDILGEEIDGVSDFDGFDDLDDLEETPITSDYDSGTNWQYTVELSLNDLVGPVPFATLMALVCEDKICSDTLVSLNGGPFAPASHFPELVRHIPAYTPTLDVEDVRNPDRRGVLGVESAPAVILALAVAGETGLLLAKEGARRKEVFVRDGSPVYASSNETKELLGEYLRARGIIDAAQLDAALKMLPRFDGHMGDTLVALGMVDAVDLFQAIAEQIKMRLEDLLFWRRGVYEFYRDATCRQDEPEIPIDPFVFVGERLSAFAAGLDAAAVLDGLQEAVVSPSPMAEELLNRLVIGQDIYEQLRRLTGSRAVKSISSGCSGAKEGARLAGAFYIAIETGIWAYDGPPLPWRSAKERPETD